MPFDGSATKSSTLIGSGPVDALVGLLNLGGFVPHGDFIRLHCPFHYRAKGSTLYVNRKTGFWGCWSTRCPQQAGGSLRRLLFLRGYDWRQAGDLIEQYKIAAPPPPNQEERPRTQKSLDYEGRVSEAHVQFWKVDWHRTREVVQTALAHPDFWNNINVPISAWADVEVQSGEVEHDHWLSLGYMLFHRGVHPSALDRLDVGFDPQSNSLVFPLREPHGELRCIARRKPEDGATAYVTASAYPPWHEDYKKLPAKRGDVLFGWHEQLGRIVRGDPIVLVEGYVDVLRLVSSGFLTVGKVGKKLTSAQVETLKAVENQIIYWPDNDPDGLLGAKEDLSRINGKPLKVVSQLWAAGQDPADVGLLKHQISVRNAVDKNRFLADLPLLLVSAKNS